MNNLKKINKLFCLFLSVLMLICSDSFNVLAAEVDTPVAEIVSSEYVNIDKHFANLTISGISSKSAARLTSSKSMNLKIKMELQKKKSGKYETIKTWTSSKTGTALTMSESRNINVLCDYRLKVTFTAGSETVTSYAYPS